MVFAHLVLVAKVLGVLLEHGVDEVVVRGRVVGQARDDLAAPVVEAEEVVRQVEASACVCTCVCRGIKREDGTFRLGVQRALSLPMQGKSK